MKAPRPTVMYDLCWIVDGIVKEVPEQNKPLAIIRYRKSILKSSSHKNGLLQERKVSNRPATGWIN